MNKSRRIIHTDINSYFATMLQQENPTLRGKPVAVVKSLGRTCVIAASKEAKLHGIKTGDNVYEARKKAASLVVVPAQFEVYLSATKKLKQVFSNLTPAYDIFSLDEAFLDVTDCRLLAPDLHAYGRYIQDQVKQFLGSWVTCNVGISHNKFLAKMASEIAPKGSVFEINSKNMDQVLLNVSFADVCGIGLRLERKLLALGIDNPYAINLLDDQTLKENFGPFWARELRKMSRGDEPHLFTHVKKTDHMQSVGRTITGYALTDDLSIVKRVLFNLMEEATYKLRSMKLSGRYIGMGVWGEGQSWYTHRTLRYYVAHTQQIFPLLWPRYAMLVHRFPVIKFGVFIGKLMPNRLLTASLLPTDQRQEKISLAMDKVNDKLGRFTVMPARLLGGNLIHPEVTGFLGDKTYYGLN